MNKTVFITGGATGIGKATAILFKKLGYNTVIGYFSSEESAKQMEKEYDIFPVYCDVTKEESILSAVEKIHSKYGLIDILVNSAGFSLSQNVVTSVTSLQYDMVMDINLKGVFNVTKIVLKDMLEKKSGAICNISSIWGLDGGSCEVVYSASKGGVTAFTKALSKELGLSNIRVNEVAPGFIGTKMNEHLSEEDKKSFCEGVSLGRIGKVDEVAKAVLFLVSDDASYVTGQTLRVDGGKF